ncbi:hypothetical protein BB2000_1218 [Proteus mirabilis BB2000]|nr:hypothetical protein BB2000_1218 [Proteus mirabilis BB2000]
MFLNGLIGVLIKDIVFPPVWYESNVPIPIENI